MKIINVQQGSEEWFTARCGIPTSSNFDKIVMTNGKPSKQRDKYLYQLAGERVAGKQAETYQNATMIRGIEMEAEARQLYEVITGGNVEQVGLCITEGKAIYAASPDGLIKDGLVEIKSPLIHTHVSYLINGGLVKDYFQQLQGQLLVTGRKWVEVMSYYPGLKPLLVPVDRDEVFLKALQVELEVFCGELDELAKKLK